LFSLSPRQFNSEQQTPIFYDDHIFGIRKHGGGKLVCLDQQGNEIWNSGRERFGHGPYMISDGVILTMSGDGRLVMVEASTEQYRPVASYQVFEDGHDAWGPMSLVSGRLIVRDMTRMACLDLNVPSQ
jgi:outer membrane protein assembly factor BamB